MNVSRINRLGSLYNATNTSAVTNAPGVGSVGSSSAQPRTRTPSPAQEALVTPAKETAASKDLAAVYTSPDGDSAEISKKAMELWRGAANGGNTTIEQPFSRQPGMELIFSRDLELPSPFLNWEEIINTTGPAPTGGQTPGTTAPPVPPPKTEPPATAAPNYAPPVNSPTGGPKPELNLPGPEPGSVEFETVKPRGECKTCASRRYVDQSDDPSVSFQTPTKVSPNMAMGAVTSHENEHVRNEQSKAQREGREIVNQTVTLTYDCCPECGRNYVSGGTTRTTSISRPESDNKPEPVKAPDKPGTE